MGQYKDAMEYAGKARALLEESKEKVDTKVNATASYIYGVCCTKYADCQQYACEKVYLKEEAKAFFKFSKLNNALSRSFNLFFGKRRSR